MLSTIVPTLKWDILLSTWSLSIHHSVRGLSLAVAFYLVMLSYGLMHGKRHAWRMTVLLLLASALLSVLRGGSVLASAVTVALATLLISLSRYFQARSDTSSVWRGYLALFMGLGLVVFYTADGVLVHLLFHAQLPSGAQAFFFQRGLLILCLSVLLYGMLQVLHPVAATLLPNKQERQAVTALAHAYGKNSISYFALAEDKSYFFTTSGKSFISYVLQGNVAVVAGDPIGPEEEMSSAIEQFLAFCEEQDWMPVFWQLRDDLADLYRRVGLHLLKIGEDAVIYTDKFTLKGGAMANVRSSARRAEAELGFTSPFWELP